MTVEALGVFLIGKDGRTGAVELRLHNVLGRTSDGSIKTTYNVNLLGDGNHIYNYVPFIYQGGTRNRNGDRLQRASAHREHSTRLCAQGNHNLSAHQLGWAPHTESCASQPRWMRTHDNRVCARTRARVHPLAQTGEHLHTNTHIAAHPHTHARPHMCASAHTVMHT